MSEAQVDPRITDADARAFLATLTPRTRSRQVMTMAEARAGVPATAPARQDGVTTRDVLLTALAHPVTARLYLPTAEERPAATVVYLHGGGWALGDLDTNDHTCRSLAELANVVILSLDYPLAPEHPFPAALDVAAEVCARVAAGTLGVPALEGSDGAGSEPLPRRLVVGGLSAGGALAAALAARGARGDGSACAAAVLLCPVLDADLSRESYREYAAAPILAASDMAWFWSLYDPEGVARRNPDAAPLAAASFAGLPPTVMAVAGVDPLRDEALAYAAALEGAGVDVTCELVPGVPHGFMEAPSIRSGGRALADVAARLRAILASG